MYKTRSCVPFPYVLHWVWKTRTLAPYTKRLVVPSSRLMEFNRLLLAVGLYGDQLVRLRRTKDEFPRLHAPAADHPDFQPVLNLLGQFCFSSMILFTGEDDPLRPAYGCQDSKSYLQVLGASGESFSRTCAVEYGKQDTFLLHCEAPDPAKSFILTRWRQNSTSPFGLMRAKN